MSSPEIPPPYIVVGIADIAAEVRGLRQEQQETGRKLDQVLTEFPLRVGRLEKTVETQGDDIDTLKETSVTRTAMWGGIGVCIAAASVIVTIILK